MFAGFQDPCIKPLYHASTQLVPQARLELARLSALASKTSVAAITPPGQFGGPWENRTPN